VSMIDRTVQLLARATAKAVVETRSTIRPVSGGYGSTDTLRLTNREQRWSASAVAYRCISTVSGGASSLRLQVLREDGTEIEGHPLSRLWGSPNPLMSGRIFGEYLWQRLETRGETFVYLDRGESGAGQIQGMWPIFGDVVVHVDKAIAGEVVGYEVTVNGVPVPFLPSEILWLRYPDAENEWGCLAPLTAAAHAIGLDAHARAWQANELRNGGQPKSVVYLGDLSEEQFQETVDSYRSKVEGAHNAGRALFVGGKTPAKVERMSLTPEELGWMDTRSSAWEEILVAWGFPKDFLLGGATYENRAASRSTVWSEGIVPKLEVVAGELARQVLNPGERARFDTDDIEALQESADAKVTRAVQSHTVDITTIDEARAEIGLEPLPGGMGAVTLTPYRVRVQLEAQAALMQAGDTNARQLQRVAHGAIQQGDAATPLFALPAPTSKRAGLSYTQAQHEYAKQERIGLRAVKRLASKQEAVVLANLHKLYGRSGEWARAREELAALTVLLNDAPSDETRAEVEVQLRAQVDKLLNANKAEAMTRDQLGDFLDGVWSSGGATTAKALGVSFDQFDTAVTKAMDSRLKVLAGQVTATTQSVLESRVLAEGVAAGESVTELAARVRSVYSDLSTWRATLIARTETVGGFNEASQITAKETGVVSGRVWLATGDDRTRDSHVDLDGYPVKGMGGTYPNGCRFPGDPDGPPEETDV
jgi:HK97 family phage portal protein